MRAGFTDPEGPRLSRIAPYAVPVLLLLFAVFAPIARGPALVFGAMSVALFNLLGLVGHHQRTPRMAEIACYPGYVDVHKSGLKNQRIWASNITGATTARTSTGLLLTLQHRRRDRPITLELESDGDAEKVRRALGIGHGGVGTIAWHTLGNQAQGAANVGRLIAVAVALFVMFLTLARGPEAGEIAAGILGQLGLFGALLGVAGLLAPRSEPSVIMRAEGLHLKTPRGWFALPYDAIHDVHDHHRGLVFSVPQPYVNVAVGRVSPILDGPSLHDRKVLIAQIMAAARRARGLGPQKADVTGRLDVLRRNGESPRDWLVRLDMAGRLLSARPGYRGNTLETEDLWTVLEDPEAEPDLRAAAARVLRHSQEPNARVRIDAATAAVRDPATSRRLRIAVEDDLEGASQELAFLDATSSEAVRHATVHGRPMVGQLPHS